MKVRELIEVLSRVDQDGVVRVHQRGIVTPLIAGRAVGVSGPHGEIVHFDQTVLLIEESGSDHDHR